MSDTWHGGKGSKSRVSNYGSYWDCPLWKNKEKMNNNFKKCLFLDDMRKVEDAILWDQKISLIKASGISSWKWDIVRSYDEFVKYIDTNGIPDVVSFDNDLFDVRGEVSNEVLNRQFQMIGWQDFKIKTGAHCAEYLVNACKARNVKIPEYYIHTANSAARPIIREILENGKLQIQIK